MTTQVEQHPPLISSLSQVKYFTFPPMGQKENGSILECEPERTEGIEADGIMPVGFLSWKPKVHCRFKVILSVAFCGLK